MGGEHEWEGGRGATRDTEQNLVGTISKATRGCVETLVPAKIDGSKFSIIMFALCTNKCINVCDKY